MRSDKPLINVRIFAGKRYALSLVYIVIMQASVLALGYLIPYYAQVACGLDEFAAGRLLLPGCIIGAVLAPLGGRILDAFGARRPITFGAFANLRTMACFLAFGFSGNTLVLAAIYVLVPISQGFSAANSITNGLTYLPNELKSDGNAANNTLQQLGGAAGTAIATSIVDAAQAALPASAFTGTSAGAHQAMTVLLAASVVALACTLAVFAKRANREAHKQVKHKRMPEIGAYYRVFSNATRRSA